MTRTIHCGAEILILFLSLIYVNLKFNKGRRTGHHRTIKSVTWLGATLTFLGLVHTLYLCLWIMVKSPRVMFPFRSVHTHIQGDSQALADARLCGSQEVIQSADQEGFCPETALKAGASFSSLIPVCCPGHSSGVAFIRVPLAFLVYVLSWP